MTDARQQTVANPVDMHRRHWSGDLDLDTIELTYCLHRAHEQVMGTGRTALARHGLSEAEFDVLATLRRSPPPRQLTPSEVGAQLLITSGGLTKVMDKLAARGLVDRPRHGADQRIRPVKLTAAGKRLVERAMQDVMAASTAGVRGALTARELKQLTTLLGKLTP